MKTESEKLKRFNVSLNTSLLLLTVAALVAGYLVIARPLEARLADINSQTKIEKELIEKAPTLAQLNRSLKEDLEKTRVAIEQLEKRIPSSPRESDFLAQICQLADRVGMEVVDYQSGNTQTLPSHTEMEVRLNTRGKYEPLCKFLDQIDQMPRLARLTSFDVTPEPAGSDLSCVMKFRIYFSSPTETTPARQG